MQVDTEMKIKALAAYLGINAEDVAEQSHDETMFDADGGEYMVLTDEEADEKAADSIRESVWAFNPDFLASHSSLDAAVIAIIQGAKYEDANAPLLKTIDDVQHFIDDAISADGRGHFLNTYDGHENEQGIMFQNGTRGTLFIYRMN